MKHGPTASKSIVFARMIDFSGCAYRYYLGMHGPSIKAFAGIHEGVNEDKAGLECHDPNGGPIGPPTTHPHFTGCLKCRNDSLKQITGIKNLDMWHRINPEIKRGQIKCHYSLYFVNIFHIWLKNHLKHTLNTISLLIWRPAPTIILHQQPPDAAMTRWT